MKISTYIFLFSGLFLVAAAIIHWSIVFGILVSILSGPAVIITVSITFFCVVLWKFLETFIGGHGFW